jgi:hypothetical protein
MDAWAFVEFLIDTGAGVTSLGPADAILQLGLDRTRLADATRWPFRETHYGIGGTADCFPVDAAYAFLHDDGSTFTVQGRIRLEQLRSDNEWLPSLLGWDVLQFFRLTTDWEGRSITLEVAKSEQARGVAR